jgi:pyruvate dehydrogenase (quinone)
LQAAEILGAPIVKALLGKAAVPDDSPYTTGQAGLLGTRPSQDALEKCDTLLMVGTSFPYIEFFPKPGQARAVQIELDPARLGLRYPVEVGLIGDSRRTLAALLPLLERNDDRGFLEQAQKDMQAWWKLMEDRGTRPDVPSMGNGLPYAIAAQVAYPDRQCVAFVGDGGFSMLMAELATCVKYKLPVKVVVVKNNTLGMIKWEQMVFLGNPEYGCELQPIDFAAFAKACGAVGFTVEDPAKCGTVLDEALAVQGPALVEAVVDPFVPPMPPKITVDQAAKFGEALLKGTPNRDKIVLTVLSDKVKELI